MTDNEEEAELVNKVGFKLVVDYGDEEGAVILLTSEGDPRFTETGNILIGHEDWTLSYTDEIEPRLIKIFLEFMKNEIDQTVEALDKAIEPKESPSEGE